MNKRGQALVEFVLILPILILLILGFVDVARVLYAKGLLESRTSEVIDMIQEGKSDHQIQSFLEIDSSIVFTIEQVNDGKMTFSLNDTVLLLTPGASLIIDNPYSIQSKRVIRYD